MTFYVSIKCPRTSHCFLVVVAVAFVCFVSFSVLLVFVSEVFSFVISGVPKRLVEHKRFGYGKKWLIDHKRLSYILTLFKCFDSWINGFTC